jgi:hypothetical protein
MIAAVIVELRAKNHTCSCSMREDWYPLCGGAMHAVA